MSIVYQILGGLLILAGIPLFWTPVPIGLVMIAIGLSLIIANSNAAREWIRTWRSKNPGLDRWLKKAERIIPHPFDRILEETDAPNSD